MRREGEREIFQERKLFKEDRTDLQSPSAALSTLRRLGKSLAAPADPGTVCVEVQWRTLIAATEAVSGDCLLER